jgi:hypothetical protein
MTITPDQLVARKVHYCVSFLVSTIAGGYGLDHFQNGGNRNGKGASKAYIELADLAERAMELCSPIDDYEEAAFQAGWVARPETVSTDGVKSDWCVVRGTTSADSEHTLGYKYAETWQEACEADGLEPYQREVFEHWIVSDWLADRLAEKGEKVGKDFAGMTIWARTTSGQGIASDSVIEAICAEINAKA